jgi:hypothetical protein
MVFALPFGEFYRDVTNPFSLSGHTHLDNFIVTRKSCPLTGTLQKHMPTATQTATHLTAGPLAQIFQAHGLRPLAVFYMFHLDVIISALLPGPAIARPKPNTCANSKKPNYLIRTDLTHN